MCLWTEVNATRPIPDVAIELATQYEIQYTLSVPFDPLAFTDLDRCSFICETRTPHADWTQHGEKMTCKPSMDKPEVRRQVYRRDPNILNPGSQVDIRARVVSGRLKGMVSPAVTTAFVHGPMSLPIRHAQSQGATTEVGG